MPDFTSSICRDKLDLHYDGEKLPSFGQFIQTCLDQKVGDVSLFYMPYDGACECDYLTFELVDKSQDLVEIRNIEYHDTCDTVTRSEDRFALYGRERLLDPGLLDER